MYLFAYLLFVRTHDGTLSVPEALDRMNTTADVARMTLIAAHRIQRVDFLSNEPCRHPELWEAN